MEILQEREFRYVSSHLLFLEWEMTESEGLNGYSVLYYKQYIAEEFLLNLSFFSLCSKRLISFFLYTV